MDLCKERKAVKKALLSEPILLSRSAHTGAGEHLWFPGGRTFLVSAPKRALLPSFQSGRVQPAVGLFWSSWKSKQERREKVEVWRASPPLHFPLQMNRSMMCPEETSSSVSSSPCRRRDLKLPSSSGVSTQSVKLITRSFSAESNRLRAAGLLKRKEAAFLYAAGASVRFSYLHWTIQCLFLWLWNEAGENFKFFSRRGLKNWNMLFLYLLPGIPFSKKKKKSWTCIYTNSKTQKEPLRDVYLWWIANTKARTEVKLLGHRVHHFLLYK